MDSAIDPHSSHTNLNRGSTFSPLCKSCKLSKVTINIRTREWNHCIDWLGKKNIFLSYIPYC